MVPPTSACVVFGSLTLLLVHISRQHANAAELPDPVANHQAINISVENVRKRHMKIEYIKTYGSRHFQSVSKDEDQTVLNTHAPNTVAAAATDPTSQQSTKTDYDQQYYEYYYDDEYYDRDHPKRTVIGFEVASTDSSLKGFDVDYQDDPNPA